MKVTLPAKYLSLTALVLSFVVGCASQPQQVAAPSGPSPAVTQALDSARAAVKDAKALDWIWRDTEKTLKSAEEAAAAGDEAKAIKLAKTAQDEAEAAVNQYYIEKSKPLLARLQSYRNLNAQQKAALQSGAQALANAEGKKAYDILSQLAAELKAGSLQYEVVSGDSLWGISGRAEVYNNPYQWPLIYKANADKIADADLIYPGQVFNVDRNPSAAEVDAAVRHAETRGAWTVGSAEQADRRYLGELQVR
ncbi:MAG: LysM peptidoglycan-binding domain-containing protein [Gammaproteobacteria bacterium]|nr:LysM peptidoglycan-binding domain-containing protein [Gammaproteobacteria bacterium]